MTQFGSGKAIIVHLVVLGSMCLATVLFVLALESLPHHLLVASTNTKFESVGFEPALLGFFSVSQQDYINSNHDYNDVVCFGDSACLFGIDEQLFTKTTGMSCKNLGVTGVVDAGGAREYAAGYIKHHPAPKLIIFCWHPHPLSENARLTAEQQRAEEMSRTHNRWRAAATRLNMVVGIFRTKEHTGPPLDIVTRLSVDRLSESSQQAVASLIDWTEKHHIQLVIALPPILHEPPSSNMTQYFTSLNHPPTVQVILPLSSECESKEDFGDPVHLNASGKAKYSVRIAQLLLSPKGKE